MSQLDEFSGDANDVIADLEKRFKLLNDAKQALKSRGTDIADRWAEHFSSQMRSIKNAEDALNRISNVPPLSTASPTPRTQPLSEVPQLNPANAPVSALPRRAP